MKFWLNVEPSRSLIIGPRRNECRVYRAKAQDMSMKLKGCYMSLDDGTHSGVFKSNPKVVKSLPRANILKSGSVIRITPNRPNKP
jgi:hypothetical protein